MKKIVLIRFSSLGDVVLSTSVVNTLKDYEVVFVTKSLYKDLFEGLIPAENVIAFSENDSLYELRRRISNLDYDMILDLHSNLRSRILTFGMSDVQRVMKRRRERQKMLGKGADCSAYSVLSDYAELLVRSMNIKDFSPPVVEAKSQGQVPGRIILHPGAKWPLKMWPSDNYRGLYDLFEKKGYSPVFIEDESLELEGRNSHKTNTLRELIDFISTGKLFIGNDSGPSHIAAALGMPSITIFGPTHPCLGFTPQGRRAEFVTLNYDCTPCSLHGKGKCRLTSSKRAKCLIEMTPEIVYEFAIKRMFD